MAKRKTNYSFLFKENILIVFVKFNAIERAMTVLFYYYYYYYQAHRKKERKKHLTFSSKTLYTGTNGVMSCKDKRQTTTFTK